MPEFHSVGLIINPAAGRGFDANAGLARRSLSAIGASVVHTAAGQLGADAVSDLPLEVCLYPVAPKASRLQTLELARQLASQELDALLVVGGDGTLADVALVCSSVADHPPLLGVGAGSTNAGALITCPAHDLDRLHPADLHVVALTGLLASMEGDVTGVGFNDCVLGFTVVATIDGRLRDADVAAKLMHRDAAGHPGSVGQPSTRVEKVRQENIEQVGIGESVATVVIGLAEGSFIAKAITGGVCLASFAGLPAGCLVADQPLVRVELSPSETLRLPPVHSSYVSFGEEDRIVVSGVREGTALCVDGTPLLLLKPSDLVSFQVRREIVRALKLA